MQTSLPDTNAKKNIPLVFFIAPKNETEFHPEQKLTGSEAELYYRTENDDSGFAQNTASWD